MLVEPFSQIGEELVEKICQLECTDQLDLLNWDQACKEFSYAWEPNAELVDDAPAIVVSPFVENLSERDDCGCIWSYGLITKVFGKIGKQSSGKVCGYGDAARIQQFMQLTNQIRELYCSDECCEVAGYTFQDIERGELIDPEHACQGLYLSEIITFYRVCVELCSDA